MIDAGDAVTTYFIELLQKAAKTKITDIHIEPQECHYRIRWRYQGLLQEADKLTLDFARQFIASLKIMAQLDVTEKRLPQDGRIESPSSELKNIRISTCPSIFGEKVALRILDHTHQELSINKLGMTDEQLILFKNKIAAPQGLILVTGPTGSGKSSTLYAALREINTLDKNIMTIEDPIEMTIHGITQLNINRKIKLHFPELLRSLMRQDPDVMMIGEIRDRETALIAVQAAQTGHLVLSSMHCDRTSDALLRLKMLGVAPHFLNSALSLVVGQRLIRLNDGSRTGIFELAVLGNKSFHTELTLKQAGMKKVESGTSTMNELRRVMTIE